MMERIYSRGRYMGKERRSGKCKGDVSRIRRKNGGESKKIGEDR